jgi:hypothetical protein
MRLWRLSSLRRARDFDGGYGLSRSSLVRRATKSALLALQCSGERLATAFVGLD